MNQKMLAPLNAASGLEDASVHGVWPGAFPGCAHPDARPDLSVGRPACPVFPGLSVAGSAIPDCRDLSAARTATAACGGPLAAGIRIAARGGSLAAGIAFPPCHGL